MSSQAIVFIINPIAGSKKRDSKQFIDSYIKSKGLEATIEITEYKDHGKIITKKYLDDGYRHFVAVGGDGTVNEVASQLIHSDAYFSIVPMGSGNGLARTLKIPMDLENALDLILLNRKKVMDIGLLNGLPFFCTAGIGFDAYCAQKFATSNHSRGLINYVKVVLKSYFNYKANHSIFCNQEKEYFSITFANANQFGNNAFIAPDALLDDNILDCVIIEKHPKWYGVVLGYFLMSGKIRSSKYVEYFRGTEFTLKHNEKITLHIDGEFVVPFCEKIEIKTLPNALKLIA